MTLTLAVQGQITLSSAVSSSAGRHFSPSTSLECRLRNDPLCVEWDVKPYTLTHSLTHYLTGAFCRNCTSQVVFHVFFWLGYCNSAVNPFIYGLCSRDFRYAFSSFLRCDFARSRSALASQANGRMMGILQTMTMQIVARAASVAASNNAATVANPQTPASPCQPQAL